MKAADIMVSPVIVASPNDCVQQVAAKLLEHRISGMPVVDDAGAVVGVISEGDLMRRAEIGTAWRRSWWLGLLVDPKASAASFVKANAQRISDVMSRHVIAVGPETPIAEIANLLEKNRIKRVPVLENDRLVGIVSRANLLQALASSTEPKGRGAARDDAAVRQAVLAQLQSQPWRPSLLNVTVQDGVVDLWGLVVSQAEKSAARVATELVPGVRSVRDNIIVRPAGFET